jgi:DNA-binding NtrC family response regulator
MAQTALTSEGHDAQLFDKLADCLTAVRSHRYQAVILDLSSRPQRDETSIAELAEHVNRDHIWLVLPLGTGPWSEDAERAGIHNRLQSPIQRSDLERVLESLSEPQENYGSAPHGHRSKGGERMCVFEELPNNRYFLAGSPAMLHVYETILLLAGVDAPVLILGESGVGKDVAANLLHKHSKRSAYSFTSVNCAALPADLLESELFGYEAGAFTGAVKAKPGKFDLADKGTILLDEIGEMSAPMQAKLLHVLQDGRFSRLGARAPSVADVRVISATNVDIESVIAERLFREDLYYRISTFTIRIPPLRERREEIPFLVEEMIKRQAAAFQRDPVYVSPRMLSLLQEYDWPGNLRELGNVVIRMQVLQGQESSIADIEQKLLRRKATENTRPSEISESGASVNEMRSIVRSFKDQTESRLIQQALENARWNRRQAAVELRISYRTLLYKIDQYRLKETRPHLRLQGSSGGQPPILT